MSNDPAPRRRARVRVLATGVVAGSVLAGSAVAWTGTGHVEPIEPAPRAFAFRAAVVRCRNADVTDDYRFEIAKGRDGALRIGITEASGALRERVDATFTRAAMAEARGVLTMS